MWKCCTGPQFQDTNRKLQGFMRTTHLWVWLNIFSRSWGHNQDGILLFARRGFHSSFFLLGWWMKSFFPSSLIIKKLKAQPFLKRSKSLNEVKQQTFSTFSYVAVFLIVLPRIWTPSSSRPHLLCRPMPVRQEVGPHLAANSFSTDVYRLVPNHKIPKHLKRITWQTRVSVLLFPPFSPFCFCFRLFARYLCFYPLLHLLL